MSKDKSKYESILVIDNREKHIIEYIDELNENNELDLLNKNKKTKNKKIEYEVKQMDIGDIQIYVNNKLFIVIERKTIKDLVASIKDGRYREQKIRLKALVDKEENKYTKIIYLIEGKLLGKQKSSIPNSTIWSTMCKLMMRDNFIVFRTKSLKESVNFIKTMAEKAIESAKANEKINFDNTDSSNTDSNNSINSSDNIEGNGGDGGEIHGDNNINNKLFTQYASSIRIKKKENLTPGICYSRQLAQIPGVSARIATCIMNEYPTLPSLIRAYEKIKGDENDALIIRQRRDLLKDIQLSSSRKMGRKLSEKIYEYLYMPLSI